MHLPYKELIKELQCNNCLHELSKYISFELFDYFLDELKNKNFEILEIIDKSKLIEFISNNNYDVQILPFNDGDFYSLNHKKMFFSDIFFKIFDVLIKDKKDFSENIISMLNKFNFQEITKKKLEYEFNEDKTVYSMVVGGLLNDLLSASIKNDKDKILNHLFDYIHLTDRDFELLTKIKNKEISHKYLNTYEINTYNLISLYDNDQIEFINEVVNKLNNDQINQIIPKLLQKSNITHLDLIKKIIDNFDFNQGNIFEIPNRGVINLTPELNKEIKNEYNNYTQNLKLKHLLQDEINNSNIKKRKI